MPENAHTTITDLQRELMKTRDVLAAAQKHLAAHAEANAALHCAETVMYSPLHARVTAAIANADLVLGRRTGPTPEGQLASVLADLDRCAHGRHEGDVCADCGGPSKGNPHMRTGTVVGYDIGGRPIVAPGRERKHDASAWRGGQAVQDA